jgi:membrane fusion protein (multidrug efflux system)
MNEETDIRPGRTMANEGPQSAQSAGHDGPTNNASVGDSNDRRQGATSSEKHKSMLKRMVIMLICVGALFGGIFGFKVFSAKKAQQAMSTHRPPPPAVSAMTAEYQTWQPHYQAVGTTRAVRGVDVTTEIAGLVQSLNFESGEEVEKDQTLVQLNADADIALLHSLQAEAALARTTFRRDKQQFAIKAISQATLDVAAADLKSKDAQVAEQAALVAKKTIKAPFDGRLGITFVNPGQYLNPGDKIVTLQEIRSILVDFFMPQKEITYLTIGQSVETTTDAYPGRTFEGRVTVINPAVDSQTRNVQVEAAVENPKRELLPGMFVSVDIQLGHPKRYLTLPQTAVAYNPYGDTVYTIESKGKGPHGEPKLFARQVFVTVGETRGVQVAILKGIKQGDLVVTAGQLKLKNGSPVVINNEIQPSNEPAPKPEDT